MTETFSTHERRMAFLLALLGSAIPFAITFQVYGTAVERNPVTAMLIDAVGWVGVGALIPVVTVSAFIVFWRVANWGYKSVARAGMWTLAGLGILNTVNDIWVAQTLTTVSWESILVLAVIVSAPAIFWLLRKRVTRQPTVASGIAILVVMATIGSPFTAILAPSNIGLIGLANAETTSNIDLTKFSESDPNSVYQIENSSTLSFTNLDGDDTGRVYNDVGPGIKRNATLSYNFKVDNYTDNAAFDVGWAAQGDTTESGVNYGAVARLAGDQIILRTWDRNGRSQSSAISLTSGNRYYTDMETYRDNGTAVLTVYSDSGKTNVIGSVSANYDPTVSYDYLYAAMGQGSNGQDNGNMDGDVSDLTLKTKNYSSETGIDLSKFKESGDGNNHFSVHNKSSVIVHGATGGDDVLLSTNSSVQMPKNDDYTINFTYNYYNHADHSNFVVGVSETKGSWSNVDQSAGVRLENTFIARSETDGANINRGAEIDIPNRANVYFSLEINQTKDKVVASAYNDSERTDLIGTSEAYIGNVSYQYLYAVQQKSGSVSSAGYLDAYLGEISVSKSSSSSSKFDVRTPTNRNGENVYSPVNRDTLNINEIQHEDDSAYYVNSTPERVQYSFAVTNYGDPSSWVTGWSTDAKARQKSDYYIGIDQGDLGGAGGKSIKLREITNGNTTNSGAALGIGSDRYFINLSLDKTNGEVSVKVFSDVDRTNQIASDTIAYDTSHDLSVMMVAGSEGADNQNSNPTSGVLRDFRAPNNDLSSGGEGGSANNLSGRVIDQSDSTVANATVTVIGVDYDHLDTSLSTDELRQKASDLLDRAEDPIPDAWNPDLNILGQGGVFDDDAEVVAVHDAGDWDYKPTLETPKLRADAGEKLAFSVWDPTANTLIQDGVDKQLPGVQRDRRVVVEQLGPSGSVISNSTLELNRVKSVDFGSDHEYATATLDRGLYRIYPAGTKATAYVVMVGSPDSLFSGYVDTLEDEAGRLTDRASYITDKLSANEFDRTTTVTDQNGAWGVTIPSSVNTAGVSAYKGPLDELSKDPQNITLADIRTLYDTTDVQSSVYLPTSSVRASPPESNVDLELREFSSPSLSTNLSRYQDRIDGLRNLVENQSRRIADLVGNLSTAHDDLEKAYSELNDLRKRNDQLDQRVRDLLQNQNATEDINLDINASDLTDGELTQRIAALEQAIDETRDSIPTETDSSTAAETVSSLARFDGPIDSEEVAVIAHFSNGTDRPVPEEYISIDQSAATTVGQGETVVRIEDFPLGDATSVQFEWLAATPDGIAGATERVSNPLVDADPPAVNSVRVSSLAPGPDDSVTVELNPAADSTYRNLTDATVYGPDGSTLSTTGIENGRQTSFTTAGQGRHLVELTYSDLDGNQYVRRIPIKAAANDVNRPPSIRAESGPTGRYAPVGDGLDAGDIQRDGTDITIAAVVGRQQDVPSSIHAYTSDIDQNPMGDLTVRVLRGEERKSVTTRSEIVIHAQATPDDGTYIYRGENPITTDGTQFGRVTHMDNQTLIRTYTDDSGTVDLSIRRPSGLVDSTVESIRWQLAQLQLQVSGFTDALGGVGVSLGGLWLFVSLRRREVMP